MNSRSASPPNPRFRSWRPRDASSLRRIAQDLRGQDGRIDRLRRAAIGPPRSPRWPKPPVAKITRARVKASRSQVCVEPVEIGAEGVERLHQRAGGAVGPQPGVDRVERAGRRAGSPAP